MMVIEKLSSKNTEEFKELLYEARNKTPYRLNFYKYYDNQSFIVKYFVKKYVKLIKYKDKYVGYMWTDVSTSQSTKISDMYLKEEYIHFFNEKVLSIFKSSLVIYEGYEDAYTKYLINTMKMNKIRVTNLMKLNLKDFNPKRRGTNATFSLCEAGKDDELRCKLQNEIFNEDNRTPLTVDDIKYDIKQEYYLKDLCVFIKVKNKIIGYGQIIYNRDINLIVNFGIVNGYRNEGYGKDLLIKLLDMAKGANIKDIYIRVDHNNFHAKKLYSSVGFKEIGDFCSWLWAKDLI